MSLETGLPLTGERTVPGVPAENYWYARHEVAYTALAGYCAAALVLEAGCGEGYGAGLLTDTARRVLAVDYDAPACAHAHRCYPRVAVQRANLVALPVRSAALDVVVNFQVIEHLWDQAGFLAECARVLRPGGRLLVTTPNRITFSPGRDTPLNPFHTRELSGAELAGLLADAGFTVELLGGFRHGPRLRELDARHGGSLIQAQVDVVVGHLPGDAVWPAELLADVASVRGADFELTEADVDASLDLVAVARR